MPIGSLYPKDKEDFMQWNNSIRYWTSGKWNGQFFDLVPEMGFYANSYTTSHFLNDETGIYFTYWINDDSIISGNVLDISGQFKSLIWRYR